MLTLASLAHRENEVSASIGMIAAASNVSERSVQRFFREFEKQGWVILTYRSRGLADTTGQTTSKHSLDWPKIQRDAQRAFAERRAAHQKRQGKRADAFTHERLEHPSNNRGAEPAKRDRKGDKQSDAAPAKGDRLSANPFFQLGQNFPREAALETEGGASDSEQGDLASCSWDSEFNTETGIIFQTMTGKVAIAGEVAERWVGWKRTDGTLALESARRYMKQHALIVPDKIALVLFLAEYARKIALGYQGHRLDEMLAPFRDHWESEGPALRATAVGRSDA